MTEPVAYLNKYLDHSTNITRYKPENQRLLSSDPLYTAEKLHPRVKMTKKQYNRLMWDKENTDLFQCLDYFHEHDGNSKFGALTEDLRGDLAPEDIARAWLDEETIEIVPTMKWFVRSKERDNDGDYAFLTGIVNTNDWIYSKQHDDVIGMLYPFDTKEEAEKWLNPLTEAVQLAVEDER